MSALLKTRLKAFTLLECLLALLVISSSLLVFDGLSRHLAQDVVYQATNPTKDWLVFSEQLRQELDQSRLVKVENNHLYVKKGEQELAFAQSKKNDFRKTNWSGQGYQPMIQNLKMSSISESDGLIHIKLVFESGLEKEFVHAMEKDR
ncbi:competence type IV pilus minor pilin ComGF [Streptococcus merionis]|uniref:competence type IV pilus minor pilin ComGF n=1 Tax=Streptococcus merionis TaxID=400065 RepID=UPI003516C987